MKIEKMRMDDYADIYQIWLNTDGITLRAIDDSKEGLKNF